MSSHLYFYPPHPLTPFFLSLRTVIKKFSQTYMLARELGSGAFSVVKLGVHLETGRKTAVKVVSKKKLSEEDYAALLMEIQILQELDHPHIIKYVTR
ncbi:hypothetical protein EON64_11775 [archaeon]|nr:MAG: hypothetical protein EON64_11775 [archaeon]